MKNSFYYCVPVFLVSLLFLVPSESSVAPIPLPDPEVLPDKPDLLAIAHAKQRANLVLLLREFHGMDGTDPKVSDLWVDSRSRTEEEALLPVARIIAKEQARGEAGDLKRIADALEKGALYE